MIIRTSRKTKTLTGALVFLAALGGTVIAQALPASAAPADLPVVPTVQSVTAGTGTFTLTSTSRIVVDSGTASQSTSGATGPLLVGNSLSVTGSNVVSDFTQISGITPTVVTGSSPSTGDIYLKLASNSSLGTEGYTETVGSSVTISAPTTAGVFYGLQTLLQQLKAVSGHTTVPGETITDNPNTGFRGVMLDVGRRYLSVSDIEQEIRRMSWDKLNVLQLHLTEDEAFRPSMPGTPYAALAPASDAAHYSQTDITQIVAYAKANNVTVIPEIDTPAHSLPIALAGGTDRSLAAKCGAAYSQDLDITDASVRTWATTLYTTLASWFPGPYFHIGGDEVEQLDSCSYIASSGQTGAQWQTAYENQLDNALTAIGKRTMMWVGGTDILPNKDVILTDFSRNNTVLSTLRGDGYDVVDEPETVSAGMPGVYNSTSPNLYSYNPPTGAHAMGPLFAVWADAQSSGQSLAFSLREMVAKQTLLADRSWNSTPLTVSYATWQAKADSIGFAPGAPGAQITPTSTNGLPAHQYTFDSTYTPPNSSQLYAGMWNPAIGPVRVGADLSWADTAGSLFAIAQYNKPAIVAGRSGSALQFSGPTSFATIPDDDNPASWTVSAWVKRTGSDSQGSLLGNHFSDLRVEQYHTSQQVGITEFGVADYSFDYSVPLNTWTDLTFVSDATAGTTTLYANGVNEGSIAHTVDFPAGTIGGSPAYTGLLDQLSIYNQALTATQVNSDYTGANTMSKVSTGATATASSTETAAFPASNAVDSDANTRWSSTYSDPQDLTVDLGAVHNISKVEMTWQAAYAATFDIQVSSNGTTWTNLATNVAGHIEWQQVDNLNGSGRYVRLHCLTRATSFGDSVYDFSVYGK